MNYFSTYQTDMTEITNLHFVIRNWKYKITEIKQHFKQSFFFLILYNIFQIIKNVCSL